MSPKKALSIPSPSGGGGLKRLGLYAVLGVVAYGFATGQIDIGSIGSANPTTAEPVAAAKKAASTVVGIPADYLALYKANAGKCSGVDWALLAGIGYTESGHGTSKLPGVHSGQNKAGAKGPMQFKDRTWAETRGFDPSIGADVYDAGDAIKGTATYLCHYAASRGLTGALTQYGGGGGYAGKVSAKAAEYRKAG